MIRVLSFLLFFGSSLVLQCNCEAEKVQISCQYARTSHWDYVGNLNSCYGAEVEVLSRDTEVKNTVKNNDIQAILFTFKAKLHFIPAKIKENYPKLRALLFQSQPMKSLSKFDLKQFGVDLEHFNMQGFRFHYITRDLFIFNPNIKFIKLHGPHLKYIDVEFFINVPQMKRVESINLMSESCINIQVLRKDFRLPDIWMHNCTDPGSYILSLANEKLAADRYKKSHKIQTSSSSTSKPTAPSNSTKLSGIKKNISDVDCDCVLINYQELQCELHVETENCSIDHVSLTRTNATISADSSTSAIKTLRIESKLMMYVPVNFGLIFSNLRELILNSTGLAKVGRKDFSEAMRRLQVLVMTNNLLEELPVDTFDNLVMLEQLDLSYNDLTVFDSLTVRSMKKLKKLSLRGNRLMIISDNIIDVLPFVESVNLRENFCIDLEYVEDYKSEIIEKLVSNCFTTAKFACEKSNSTYRIPKLQTRSLKMKVICDHEIHTENMLTLNITNQNISLIPYKLYETFPNLVEIIVKNSHLARLTSESFIGLEELQRLNITFNRITSMEENIFSDQLSLEILDLSFNEITVLPDKIFTQLVSLKILNLSNNRIASFYASYLLVENQIEKFIISRNKLQYFESDILKYLEGCKVIALQGNVCVDFVYSPSRPSDRIQDLNKLYAKIHKCDIKKS